MFLTVTFDNGTEGARHAELKREYRIETYFCILCLLAERRVENANKLIIYYLPRSADLTKLTDRDIYLIQEKLNNRPRKCLNYKALMKSLMKWCIEKLDYLWY